MNNPARQTYDYSITGISGFLSRSIDDVAWENTLDAHLNTLGNVPEQSTQQNFDQTMVTGSLGNTLQVGGISLNNNNITVNDGTNDFLIIGDDGQGN